MLRDFPIRDWVITTALGAFIAWSVGSIPVLFGEQLTDWPLAVQVPAITFGVILILLSLGVAQWYVLRRWTDRAPLWIWATAAGWAVGLTVFTAITTPLWQPGQAAPLVIAIGVLGGLAMAAAMAATTGAFLIRILAAAPARV